MMFVWKNPGNIGMDVCAGGDTIRQAACLAYNNICKLRDDPGFSAKAISAALRDIEVRDPDSSWLDSAVALPVSTAPSNKDADHPDTLMLDWIENNNPLIHRFPGEWLVMADFRGESAIRSGSHYDLREAIARAMKRVP